MKAPSPTTPDLSTLLGKIEQCAENGIKRVHVNDQWRFFQIAKLAREAQQADLTERLERSVANVRKPRLIEVQRACGHWTEVTIPAGVEVNTGEMEDTRCGLCESGILEGR